jgi:hypothetical protein
LKSPTHRNDLLQVFLLCHIFVAHSTFELSVKVNQLCLKLGPVNARLLCLLLLLLAASTCDACVTHIESFSNKASDGTGQQHSFWTL